MSSFAAEWRAGGGRMVLTSAVGVAFGLTGLPFYTLGVFIKPLADAHGWSRAEVQGSFSFVMLAVVLGSAAMGRIVDRFGARRAALSSIIAFAIGMATLGLNPGSLGAWYATWFVVALCGLGTTPMTWTRGLADQFVSGRGTAIGIALAGTGVTALAAPPLVTVMIAAIGWRGAYFGLAGAILFIAAPIVWLGFRPTARSINAREKAESTGLAIAQVLRSFRFWILIIAIMAIGASVAGLIPNLVPMLIDKGVTPAAAAGFASLVGLSVIAGRIVSGYLVDRFWAPAIAAIILALPAISCLLLKQDVLPTASIGIAAALIGIAAGAEIDLVAFLCLRYFGLRDYGQIYGWLWAAFALSAGLAPPVFGWLYDVYGSYNSALLIAAILLLAGALLFLALGRYPQDVSREDDAPTASWRREA